MHWGAERGLRLAAAVTAVLLAAWPVAASELRPWAGTGDQPAAPWRLATLPDQPFPVTRYTVVPAEPAGPGGAEGGGTAPRDLRIDADGSYGNLVHPLPPGSPGRVLSWRWRVDVPNERVNLRQRDGDDTALKVCVLFDMPLAQVPFMERQLLRLARSRSAEPLPAATLCYLWDATLPPGTALPNAYTGRVRQIVLRGQGTPPGTWAREQRDVHRDFLQAFGTESPTVPPLQAVAVGADGDNTRGRSSARLAELELRP